MSQAKGTDTPDPDSVDREVTRILAVRDTRRAEAAEERRTYGLRTLEKRLREYEAGLLLGMCDCRPCLSGYVAGVAAQDVELALTRMCLKGQKQFSQACTWHQWVP